MSRATEPVVERLVCPRCAGILMMVEIHEGGSQKILCAGCGDVVAYTSGLVRVTLASDSD